MTATAAPSQPPMPGQDPAKCGVAEREDAAVGGDHEVPVAGDAEGTMPTIGASRLCGQARTGRMQPDPGDGAVVARSRRSEDAAVGGDEPVPVAAGRRVMPTTGRCSGMPPMEPWKAAAPNEKMPPSEPTSQ